MPFYFDNNATTPLDERVYEAMLPYMKQAYGNPSSLHAFGRYARDGIEQAREQIAQFMAVHPSMVVFTGSGTEANNLAVKGVALMHPHSRFLASAVEHSSVLEPLRTLSRFGWETQLLPVDSESRLEPSVISKYINDKTRFVSVMLVNNETGVIQDTAGVKNAMQDKDIVFHVDAIQAAGKIQFSFSSTGADLMSLSAHKIFGPKGIGALIKKSDVDLVPLIDGGAQEMGWRSGTENVAAIVGFGKAAEIAGADMNSRMNIVKAFRDAFESRLKAVPGISLLIQKAKRVPNTSLIAVEGYDSETLLMQLDQKGIQASSGAACGAQKLNMSHVLEAMALPYETAMSAIRVSFSHLNSMDEVDKIVSELKILVKNRLAVWA